MTARRILRNRAGRLRLGWALVLFLGIVALVTWPLTSLLPPRLPWNTLPYLAGALVAGWVLLALDGRGPGALGFHLRREALLETGLGAALGVLVALATILVMASTGGLRWEVESGTPGGLVAAGLGALWMLALPAAAEEALFRGYPLQALAESWGPKAALGLTAAGFGLLHLSNPGATAVGTLNVALAGLFLGVLVLRTRSLWLPTGAHLGWNWGLAFLADAPVSGLDLVDVPYVRAVPGGPDWLGGGAFGPEGSLAAAGPLLLAGLWAWRSEALKRTGHDDLEGEGHR